MSAGRSPGAAPPVAAGDRLEVLIEDLAFGGKGVGRAAGFVVFVEGGLPGERVRARIRRVRRGFAEASCEAVLQPSPDRVDPPCRHYGPCGGCDLQHLAVPAQARAKREQVVALLRRVARVPEPVVAPALVAGAASEYRGRMDFDWGRDASGAAALGLHRRGDAARVLAIEECRVLPREADGVRNTLALLARGRGLSTRDPRTGRGLLRRATLRQARSTGEILVVLETGRGDPPELAALVRELQRRHPRIVGVVRRAFDREGILVEESILAGRDHLFEEVDGDRYRVPAESFFQPNAAGLPLLRRTALELLAPAAGERVLELYAGVGFFTVSLARRAAEVTAIEGSRIAVGAARDNLAAAGCANVHLVQGDAARMLPSVLSGERFAAGLVDPPRTGLVPGVLESLASSGPPRLVYVSCDPATLARDVRGFVAAGFGLVRVVPIDLFPHTHHVECVALLERPPAS